MADIDLQNVLYECKTASQRGYNIAYEQYHALHETISNAREEIDKALATLSTSSCNTEEATDILSQQFDDIKSDLSQLSFAFKDGLQALQAREGKFSVTLFGRTSTGKSTLMEVLTHGDGSSIGKGAQRTTLSVRKYEWNGLEITDVPGTGAVDGAEDETVAYQAAKEADLILFLITDNGAQPSEAEWFSKVVSLGKPVIGIINVRTAISERDSTEFVLKRIEKAFNKIRLDTIKDQFCEYAEKHGQSWQNIPFVYVHLHSAFKAQQAVDINIKESFHKASRIDDLTDLIVSHVKDKGLFECIKTYIDIISNPILTSMENLLGQGLSNSSQGRVILDKKRKLMDWKKRFMQSSNMQIESHIARLRGDLNAKIASFAEVHYADDKATDAWKELLESSHVQDKCQEVLVQLESQCNETIGEIAREIINEIKFTSSVIADASIKAGHVGDGQRIWNRVATYAGAGVAIGGAIAWLAGAGAVAATLGWVTVAVGVIGTAGSFLFSSRSKEEHEARVQLENDLKKEVSSLCESLEHQIKAEFTKLIKTRVDSLIKELIRIDSVLFGLADTQKKLAWYLDTNLLNLNVELVKEALHFFESEDQIQLIRTVARVPGFALTFVLDSNVYLQAATLEKLTELMGEDINCILDSSNKKILISRVIGDEINRDAINIESKTGTARITTSTISSRLINRLRMAQQLSRIVISK